MLTASSCSSRAVISASCAACGRCYAQCWCTATCLGAENAAVEALQGDVELLLALQGVGSGGSHNLVTIVAAGL